jgi:hypothetical protein
VLRVASNFVIMLPGGTKLTCKEAVQRLAKGKRRWEVRSAGKGSKGDGPAPVTPDQLPPAQPGLIPLTIPEIKRLLAALTTRPLPPWDVIRWDAWTRRHQARSRWFHKRARLARDGEPALVS